MRKYLYFLCLFFYFTSEFEGIAWGVNGQNFVSGPGVWEWEKWLWLLLHLRLNYYKDEWHKMFETASDLEFSRSYEIITLITQIKWAAGKI